MALKVWTNTKFRGFFPVGSAAIIISETKGGAENALFDALLNHKLETNREEIEAMELMPMEEGSVVILCDGNY